MVHLLLTRENLCRLSKVVESKEIIGKGELVHFGTAYDENRLAYDENRLKPIRGPNFMPLNATEEQRLREHIRRRLNKVRSQLPSSDSTTSIIAPRQEGETPPSETVPPEPSGRARPLLETPD